MEQCTHEYVDRDEPANPFTDTPTGECEDCGQWMTLEVDADPTGDHSVWVVM